MRRHETESQSVGTSGIYNGSGDCEATVGVGYSRVAGICETTTRPPVISVVASTNNASRSGRRRHAGRIVERHRAAAAAAAAAAVVDGLSSPTPQPYQPLSTSAIATGA